MNESSEVKAFAGSASNLSGRSIKRKLQRRTAASNIMRLVDENSTTEIGYMFV